MMIDLPQWNWPYHWHTDQWTKHFIAPEITNVTRTGQSATELRAN
jgi:hypothetical protein